MHSQLPSSSQRNQEASYRFASGQTQLWLIEKEEDYERRQHRQDEQQGELALGRKLGFHMLVGAHS
jgi:hypothetical protein